MHFHHGRHYDPLCLPQMEGWTRDRWSRLEDRSKRHHTNVMPDCRRFHGQIHQQSKVCPFLFVSTKNRAWVCRVSFICPLLEDEDSIQQRKRKDTHSVYTQKPTRSHLFHYIIPELLKTSCCWWPIIFLTLVNSRSILSRNIGLETSQASVYHFDRDVHSVTTYG